MEFEPFHRYSDLVKWGRASPILCPHCNEELYLRGVVQDGAYQPVLHCYTCLTNIAPGEELYIKIINAIERDRLEQLEDFKQG